MIVATKGYEKATLGNDIIAYISPEARSGVVSGNAIAVAGEECVMVVDSGHFPPTTKRIIADIRENFGKPVRFLLNTHWHNDHWRGNYLYREEYPNVVILSHPSTKRQIEDVIFFHPSEIMKRIPNGLRSRREMLETGKRTDGTILDDQAKQFTRDELRDVEDYVQELPGMRVETPNLTFDGEVHLDLGKRQVRLWHLGRGNTAGDVVALVPDARVLMTGDLVVSPTPYSYGSYLGEWIGVLKRLKETGAETIVPGHGPVQHDWQYVDTVVDLLQSALAQVDDAIRQGLSLEETRKKVNLSEYERRLAGSHQYRRKAFLEYFVEPAIERAYLELKFSKE